MTQRIELSEEAKAAPPARRRFALEVLGVALFVSAYLHATAGPAFYYVAKTQAVSLFSPRQDRASVELTMALPSQANEPSAEIIVRPQRLAETISNADSDADDNARRSFDALTASPVNVQRIDAAPASYVSERSDLPKHVPEQETASASRVAPRPLARREDATAARKAERVEESHSVARSRTIDSPSQAASEIRLGAEAERLPELVRNPPPVYPPQALKAGVEGRTIVRAKIGRTGEVLEASIAESSGSSLLDQAALQAVRSWAFRPGTRFGLTVEQEVGVPVDFSIRDADRTGAKTDSGSLTDSTESSP